MRDQRKDGAEPEWKKEQRKKAGIDERMIVSLRNLGHVLRSVDEGKGSQRRILIILNGMGGQATQRELTERLGIQSGSASEVIGKLERAGYVRRTANASDRRNVDVILTEEGRELACEAKRQRIRLHEEMFACLNGEEKEKLAALLEKVNEDWDVRFADRPKRQDGGKPHPHGHHGGGRRREGE